MKYVKMFGLLAVSAAALLAFVGTATATVRNNGNLVSTITATSTNVQFTGTVDSSCQHSEFTLTGVENKAGHPHKAGSTFFTVTTLHFTECNRSVTVTQAGTASVTSNGAITFNGFRITVQTTILGFPVHCIAKAESPAVGTLTEHVNPTVIHVTSAIGQDVTSSLCGDDTELHATYTVTSPTGGITID